MANLTYLAIGDSITWTQANGLNYPWLVYNYIKPCKYINKGIGGINSSEMLTNINDNVHFDADLITIGIGMNDSANQGISIATYKTNLSSFIDILRKYNPKAKIILCTPSGTTSAIRTPYIASYRTAMEEIATLKDCYLCKFHEAITDANITTYSSDGIHPNSNGHILLFNKLQPIIEDII